MKILIFGASGMVGSSVLNACLKSPRVSAVRAVLRRPLPVADPKLETVLHKDFRDFTAVAPAFRDVDACLFCLGISSSVVSGEPEYREITYDYPMAAGAALRAASPNAAFQYLSGQGAGVGSRLMWARVKGEAERDLMARFDATCWRPMGVGAAPSASTPWAFYLARPFFPVMRFFPRLFIEGEDLGRAMLQATVEKVRGRIIESAEIHDFARRAQGS
jgi:nucleoside-diphosphate-sugar epimerase